MLFACHYRWLVFAFRETIYICSLLSIVVVITCFCFSHVCVYMICVHEFPLNMSDEMRLQSEKMSFSFIDA